MIVVRDHGSGLDAEALEHVFDRFWRAGSGEGGSGLGLAIVQSIVEASRGTITLADNAPHGLVVSVQLPAADRPHVR